MRWSCTLINTRFTRQPQRSVNESVMNYLYLKLGRCDPDSITTSQATRKGLAINTNKVYQHVRRTRGWSVTDRYPPADTWNMPKVGYGGSTFWIFLFGFLFMWYLSGAFILPFAARAIAVELSVNPFPIFRCNKVFIHYSAWNGSEGSIL